MEDTHDIDYAILRSDLRKIMNDAVIAAAVSAILSIALSMAFTSEYMFFLFLGLLAGDIVITTARLYRRDFRFFMETGMTPREYIDRLFNP